MKAVMKALAAAMKHIAFAMRVAGHTMRKIATKCGLAKGGTGGKVRSYKSIHQEYYGATPELRKEARDNPEWVTKPELKEQAQAKAEVARAEADEAKAIADEKNAKREEDEAKTEADKEKVEEAKKNVQAEASEKKDYRDGVRSDKVKTSNLAGKLGGMTSASATPEPKENEAKVEETEEAKRKKTQVQGMSMNAQ